MSHHKTERSVAAVAIVIDCVSCPLRRHCWRAHVSAGSIPNRCDVIRCKLPKRAFDEVSLLTPGGSSEGEPQDHVEPAHGECGLGHFPVIRNGRNVAIEPCARICT
jgi:hypothetical protein